MTLTINDNEYELKFGFKFLHYLDEKYNTKDLSGQQFGIGIETVIPRLMIDDAVTLAEVIYAGCKACDNAPKLADIEEYIEDVENIEELFEEVKDELKKQNATKKRVNRLITEIKKEILAGIEKEYQND